MQNHIKSILILTILQFSICFSSEITSHTLLEGAIKRLDGVDYTMGVNITSFDNKGKSESRWFDLSVHWNLSSDKYKMIYIEETNKEANLFKAWAHHFKDYHVDKWVMLPKSKKIKEISGKKSSEKLDLSEVSIQPSILENDAEVIAEESINDVACYLVRVHDDEEIINIWIDSTNYMIHRKEYYNKKSKLYKKVNYDVPFNDENELKYYKAITIENIKKKTKVDIFIDTLETKIFQNIDIFNFPLENEN